MTALSTLIRERAELWASLLERQSCEIALLTHERIALLDRHIAALTAEQERQAA